MLSFWLVAVSEIDISCFALHAIDDAIFVYDNMNVSLYVWQIG